MRGTSVLESTNFRKNFQKKMSMEPPRLLAPSALEDSRPFSRPPLKNFLVTPMIDLSKQR